MVEQSYVNGIVDLPECRKYKLYLRAGDFVTESEEDIEVAWAVGHFVAVLIVV